MRVVFAGVVFGVLLTAAAAAALKPQNTPATASDRPPDVPELASSVLPIYPAIAKAARVQGVVVIQFTVGPDGRAAGARVTNSISLLSSAALDAVRHGSSKHPHSRRASS